MSRYHIHQFNSQKIRQINIKQRQKKLFHIHRWITSRQKIFRSINQQNNQNDIIQFMKGLPHGMKHQNKTRLVCSKFKIDTWKYQQYLRQVQKSFQMSTGQLFKLFKKNQYQFSYLPEDIIKSNQIILLEVQNSKQIVKRINSKKQKDYQKLNPKNWHLPNVLLIVTQEMKRMFLKYGQYMGFDLTFSLIREQPENSKEYLVGIFGGTSQSRRITVYGFVITNNQSVQFFKIMGKQPETIITDQQTAIYYALKQLKQQKIFKGYHLFDTFHILKKFRKSSGYQGQIFQLFRKMIHAKNRNQYRLIFNQMLQQIRNDKQLQILKNFDYNSEMYCISQIQKTFVSTGISDGCIQKIHDIIKQQIPYQIKYIRGIIAILQVLQKRNQMNKYGYFELYSVQKKINIPFLKQYRTLTSSTVFQNIVRQVSKTITYNIIPMPTTTKRQYDKQYRSQIKRYYVLTNIGNYGVFKQSQNQGPQKWKCECQFQQKTGFLCSHIAKVLLHLGQNFQGNIRQRWLIDQQNLDQRSKNYKQHIKFFRFLRPKIKQKDIIKGFDAKVYQKAKYFQQLIHKQTEQVQKDDSQMNKQAQKNKQTQKMSEQGNQSTNQYSQFSKQDYNMSFFS